MPNFIYEERHILLSLKLVSMTLHEWFTIIIEQDTNQIGNTKG